MLLNSKAAYTAAAMASASPICEDSDLTAVASRAADDGTGSAAAPGRQTLAAISAKPAAPAPYAAPRHHPAATAGSATAPAPAPATAKIAGPGGHPPLLLRQCCQLAEAGTGARQMRGAQPSGQEPALSALPCRSATMLMVCHAVRDLIQTMSFHFRCSASAMICTTSLTTYVHYPWTDDLFIV